MGWQVHNLEHARKQESQKHLRHIGLGDADPFSPSLALSAPFEAEQTKQHLHTNYVAYP